MSREIFRVQRAESLSVVTRTEPSYSIVKRFKVYCRDQGLSCQAGVLEVIEAFLDEHGY